MFGIQGEVRKVELTSCPQKKESVCRQGAHREMYFITSTSTAFQTHCSSKTVSVTVMREEKWKSKNRYTQKKIPKVRDYCAFRSDG